MIIFDENVVCVEVKKTDAPRLAFRVNPKSDAQEEL